MLESAAEQELEIIDEDSLTVKIKVRYTHRDAGFYLIFYAPTVLIVETPSLLPRMRFFYGEGYFNSTRKRIAGGGN